MTLARTNSTPESTSVTVTSYANIRAGDVSGSKGTFSNDLVVTGTLSNGLASYTEPMSYAHAEGYRSTASASYSHAEGSETLAGSTLYYAADVSPGPGIAQLNSSYGDVTAEFYSGVWITAYRPDPTYGLNWFEVAASSFDGTNQSLRFPPR